MSTQSNEPEIRAALADLEVYDDLASNHIEVIQAGLYKFAKAAEDLNFPAADDAWVEMTDEADVLAKLLTDTFGAILEDMEKRRAEARQKPPRRLIEDAMWRASSILEAVRDSLQLHPKSSDGTATASPAHVEFLTSIASRIYDALDRFDHGDAQGSLEILERVQPEIRVVVAGMNANGHGAAEYATEAAQALVEEAMDRIGEVAQ